MKPKRTWIAAADGAHARILQHAKPAEGTKTIASEIFAETADFTRELGDDRPGRTFNSTGKMRHAIEPRCDLHEKHKEEFLRKFATHLDGALADDHYDQLILVAPPRVLGHLRKYLSHKVLNKVHGEILRDMAQRPDKEIADAVSAKFVGFDA